MGLFRDIKTVMESGSPVAIAQAVALVDLLYGSVGNPIDGLGKVNIKVLFSREHGPPGGYPSGTIIQRAAHQRTGRIIGSFSTSGVRRRVAGDLP
jgi:hypothetical protein